jgi:hypothetical protein
MRTTKLVCFTALILPLLLSACAEDKTQHYPGPPLPREQLAVVKGSLHFFGIGAYRVDLLSIDSSDVTDPVEILPGERTISVEAFSCFYWCGEERREVRFKALAGHTYEIDWDFWRSGDLLVIALETGEIVARSSSGSSAGID